MAAEALLQERARDFSGVVRQQLRLHAMDAGRLLQGFDDVCEQLFFDVVTVGTAGSIADKEVADDALALLVDKEGIAEDAAALNGGVAGKDLGVHVAEDHLGGGGVVPREQASPHGDLIFQQRAKVSGREVSEIEDFHNQVLGLRCQVSGKTWCEVLLPLPSLVPETCDLTPDTETYSFPTQYKSNFCSGMLVKYDTRRPGTSWATWDCVPCAATRT